MNLSLYSKICPRSFYCGEGGGGGVGRYIYINENIHNFYPRFIRTLIAHYCCSNSWGETIIRPPLFLSGYVPASHEMLGYIDKSPPPPLYVIWKYNYKTN